MNQIPMILTGAVLRDRGIEQATDHAEAVSEGWSFRAFEMLIEYLYQVQGRFQAEDVRIWSHNRGLDLPPSKRAWGGVIVRAKNAGLIRYCGTAQVKNILAHCANAALWEKI